MFCADGALQNGMLQLPVSNRADVRERRLREQRQFSAALKHYKANSPDLDSIFNGHS
ncbi:MAG: hypothetical protein OHK0041_05210 [Anaerolineales bacterium]